MILHACFNIRGTLERRSLRFQVSCLLIFCCAKAPSAVFAWPGQSHQRPWHTVTGRGKGTPRFHLLRSSARVSQKMIHTLMIPPSIDRLKPPCGRIRWTQSKNNCHLCENWFQNFVTVSALGHGVGSCLLYSKYLRTNLRFCTIDIPGKLTLTFLAQNTSLLSGTPNLENKEQTTSNFQRPVPTCPGLASTGPDVKDVPVKRPPGAT